MSESLWTIIPHIIPASHIRGFARGVRDEQTGHLLLALKQYVPKNRTPKTGDLTLITAPGAGQSKELYEPFYDALLQRSKLPIRAIWAMDCAHHGASYVLNENIIGDEHHWLDPSRDLLHMVNTFQNQMIPPVYGMGQSWGAAIITMASIMHPRLFSGIVSVEAVLDTGNKLNTWLPKRAPKNSEHRGIINIKRRDYWPTREEARRTYGLHPFYKAFDTEVFEKSIQYDLRDCPTPEYPKGVTLTTPKSMQVATIMVADPPLPGHPPGPEYEPGDNNVVVPGFYRPEAEQIQRSLPHVYPPVLYLWGTKSDIGMSDYATNQVRRTGIGKGGGGGIATGQVKSVCMENVGHTILLEKPKEAAETMGMWLMEQHSAWLENEVEARATQAPFNPGVINPLWLERIAKL